MPDYRREGTGPDRCISVYPEPTYSAMTSAALAGLNPMSPEAREMRRVLHGNAVDVELDTAGRVMLPPAHRSFAGIDRQVMIVGTGEALELWDRSGWEAYDRDLTQRAPDLTASLGHPA